jgi:aspartyl aminopeptidase
MAAHTDSPVLKVKPISKLEKQGYLQVGVETYGGGLWYTWFDRDLSLAGRVVVEKSDKTFSSELVCISRPVVRIPSLAIHLDREVNTAGFKPNLETNTVPVIATAVKDQLGAPKQEKGEEEATAKRRRVDAEDNKSDPSQAKANEDHQPVLLRLLAEELQVDVSAIKDFELCLYDTQPAQLIGAYEEFIASRALDNLMMSFISVQALVASEDTLAEETQIRMVGLFDNEEVGSVSTMGAGSNLLRQVLFALNNDAQSYDAAIRNSFLMSCDMAHAVHPNYGDKHEDKHRPAIHKGLVVKQNANQRYATSGVSSFLISELARRHSIPLQKFCVRNDVGCGSTIGPMLSASLGIRTVDVGVPMLSMHSVREMCGTQDCLLTFQLMTAAFSDLNQLDKSLANAD